MSATRADVEETIRSFLVRANKPVAELKPDLQLFNEGLGLDSLETAELSAVLEDEYEADPFSSDVMPQTVGDILGFYAPVTAEA